MGVRYPFRGRVKILLRDETETDYPRRADREDRTGREMEVVGTDVRVWTSKYTIRIGNLDRLGQDETKWVMFDEFDNKCRIDFVAMVPKERPGFLILFVEKIA